MDMHDAMTTRGNGIANNNICKGSKASTTLWPTTYDMPEGPPHPARQAGLTDGWRAMAEARKRRPGAGAGHVARGLGQGREVVAAEFSRGAPSVSARDIPGAGQMPAAPLAARALPCTLEHLARVSCQLLLFEDASLSQWLLYVQEELQRLKVQDTPLYINDRKMSRLSEGVNAE